MNSKNRKIAAGQKHEATVDYYLQRELSDLPSVRVFHDVRIEHGGFKAQIDHLVLYPRGFVLIESKSIYGSVKVNANGEWQRSYQSQWMGIPSPIQQLLLQKKTLKKLLASKQHKLLRKILGVQGKFGGRQYHCLVAVSSSAMLDRSNMPKDVSENVFKAEFIADRVREICKPPLSNINRIGEPNFTDQEMANLRAFLASFERAPATPPIPISTTVERKRIEPTLPDEPIALVDADKHSCSSNAVPCKHCGCINTAPYYGRHGYYVSCRGCNKNTAMKKPCPQCQSNSTRVQKRGDTYSLVCQENGHMTVLIGG